MQQAATEVAAAPTGPLRPFTSAPQMAAVGGAGGPQREVFGFGLLSSLADPYLGYPSWNFSLLTTVAVFGLHVNDDGTLATDSGWNVWNSSQLTGLITTAHNAGTKVVLTIILQDFSSGTPHMCAGLKNRATTVTQTVAQVAAKGVDGVNVDYEGLQGTCANGENPRADMTDLAHRLQAALPAASYLSIDTYASSAGDPSGFFDIPGLNAYVSSFFVMAYDSDFSNYGQAPLAGCTHYCLTPGVAAHRLLLQRHSRRHRVQRGGPGLEGHSRPALLQPGCVRGLPGRQRIPGAQPGNLDLALLQPLPVIDDQHGDGSD